MSELKYPILGEEDFDNRFRDLAKELRERNTRYSQDSLHKAYENVIFDYGRHWVTFDPVVQQFRPKRTKKWTPKPVTNKFGAVMRPLIANLAGIDPILQYAPCSDDPVDVATANVASRIVEICRQETKIIAQRPKLARWVGLTGNGWLISGYDNDIQYGMVSEQAEQCVTCGKSIMPDDIVSEGGCPWCKEAGMESQGFMPAFDEMGQPVMGQRPRGALFTELATIFEMEYDHEADSFEDSMYALRMRSRDREWAKSHFNMSDEDLADGMSGLSPLMQQRYLQSLAYISPIAYQLYYAKPYHENRVLVTDMWINPTKENPEGVYGIMIGDHVVYSGPYRYHAPDSKPDAPRPSRTITHFGYQVAAGRIAYRTPADDLTSMQRTRNELESIYKLHARRAAGSIMWVPDGTNVSKISGEEGLVLRYTAMANVPPPRREAGLESPRFIREWIDLIDASMEIVAGSMDVLRGEAPAGLEAYAALQQLEAKAMQALAESRLLWNISWAQWSTQVLGIFKEYAIDERQFSMRGENGAWAIEKFKKSDLEGALRILPDVAQTTPSSPVAKRAGLEQLVRIGFVNPNDPQEKYRVFQMYDMSEFMQDMDIDTKAAAIENDAFFEIFVEQAPTEPPAVNPFIDNDDIHLVTHTRFFKSDKGKQLGPLGQGALMGHISQHQSNIMKKMLAMQGGMAPSPQRAEGMASQGGPSASKAVKSEAGAASQPERANDMGKPKQGKKAARLEQTKSEQNIP